MSQRNLWDILLHTNNQTADEETTSEESSLLFVGNKSSGKTSIILRFLDRDEIPKPTIALEYTFGRRTREGNMIKDVGHLWEIGGGTWLTKLVDVPLNRSSVNSLAAVIVVDLSSPQTLWDTLETWLQTLRSRIEETLSKQGEVKDKLTATAWERVGHDHPDKESIHPFLIPMAIIGGKYDVFQDFDSEKRKFICRMLRYVSLVNGAHLQFFSGKQEGLITRSRSLISHLLFGTPSSKTSQTDHNKPLIVSYGQDSLQQIGDPSLPDDDISRVTAKSQMQLWKIACHQQFGQEKGSVDPLLTEDPAKDQQYAEPVIDNLRAQKFEELERYRRLTERKALEHSNNQVAHDFSEI